MKDAGKYRARKRITKPIVLLVDDDGDQLDLYEMLLERTNCTVVTAQSAEAALEILELLAVDMVVTDVFMPGISGSEFVRELRSFDAYGDLPIIAISAAPEELGERLLEVGATKFLPKGKTASLLREVEEHLLPLAA